MERSVNVNAGSYGTPKLDARPDAARDGSEPADFAFDEPEPASNDSPDTPRWVEAPKPPDLGVPKSIGAIRSREARRAPNAADQGPCLYFGPAGQRCDRRAVEGGFCSRHQPADRTGGSRSLSVPEVSKRALGAAGILAVLWPILADLIRELLRLLR